MTPSTHTALLELETIGEVTVVKFTVQTILEADTIRELGQQLASLGEQWGQRNILLNFSGVTRLSSPMLARLLVLLKKVQAAGGRLALCSIHPNLTDLFEITRLTRMFRIYRDEQEALQSF
jgi:anti-anti-sigma factor